MGLDEGLGFLDEMLGSNKKDAGPASTGEVPVSEVVDKLTIFWSEREDEATEQTKSLVELGHFDAPDGFKVLRVIELGEDKNGKEDSVTEG